MQQINNLLLGSDIEFFVQTLRGDVIPAIGMVGGTKAQPKPLGQKFFIQEDNVSVEFNIPPSSSAKNFAANLNKGLSKCRAELPAAVAVAYGKASVLFHAAYIDNTPQALEFGCEPDMNAWTKTINPRPKAENKYLRSCGGHVHMGWDNPDMETRFELIKMCDVFCSLPSLWEDDDKKRRELYGKAGAMRIKPYGVEHRVLSNYFLWDTSVAYAVGKRYETAVGAINKGLLVDKRDEDSIQEAINTSNVEWAKRLYNKYNKLYDNA